MMDHHVYVTLQTDMAGDKIWEDDVPCDFKIELPKAKLYFFWCKYLAMHPEVEI